MIVYSTSLRNRIDNAVANTIERAVGSHGTLMFYSGAMPATADEPPSGAKISHRDMSDAALAELRRGIEPDMPTSHGYWRLLDNGALVIMQGDGKAP